MSINLSILLIILGCAMVTFIPRIIPFIVIRNMKLPKIVVKWLSFIPICIFTALIVDSFISKDQSALISINWSVLLCYYTDTNYRNMDQEFVRYSNSGNNMYGYC